MRGQIMRKMFTALFLLLLAGGAVYGKTFKVLVLTGNTRNVEFPVLEKFKKLGPHDLEFTSTSDRTLPDLENYDILWIGQGEICEGAYFLDKETEEKIKSFVENGGIVISVGQDSDAGRPCEVGWLPEVQLVGVERGGTNSFEVTGAPEVDDLFKVPNEVKQAHFDDAWTQPDPRIIVLATINAGQDLGIGLLIHGKGAYIITSLQNETASEVSINAPIMENLLYYAVNHLPTILMPVELFGKLSVIWGELKRARM